MAETTWAALLKYADAGGALLITGPVERDEHWHIATRAAGLKQNAHAEPLTAHNAGISLGGRAVPLSLDQSKQLALESLQFGDGSTFKEISYCKGKIFWAAYPVELSEGATSTSDLYSYVAARVGLSPMFELKTPLSAGVLVYPTVLQDSVLYVLVSDSADDADVSLRDKLTGTLLTLKLPAQHAALALIGKQEKKVIAQYGF